MFINCTTYCKYQYIIVLYGHDFLTVAAITRISLQFLIILTVENKIITTVIRSLDNRTKYGKIQRFLNSWSLIAPWAPVQTDVPYARIDVFKYSVIKSFTVYVTLSVIVILAL